ncbi:hypothetical protein INR49_019303 [Caranx melampygus]|nr:hypothetical protein INR49_019303 [Caranx melampygus]
MDLCSVPETTFDLHGDVHSGAALPTSKSSGKLEMERGMVKPMIRGEQQDSRSQDISADRTELTLPASIEFRDNCECVCLFPLSVSVTRSIAGNY